MLSKAERKALRATIGRLDPEEIWSSFGCQVIAVNKDYQTKMTKQIILLQCETEEVSAFIAAARTALPQLLKDLDELEQALLNCHNAMTRWAQDEDGVPEEAWTAYQEAHRLTNALGEEA